MSQGHNEWTKHCMFHGMECLWNHSRFVAEQNFQSCDVTRRGRYNSRWWERHVKTCNIRLQISAPIHNIMHEMVRHRIHAMWDASQNLHLCHLKKWSCIAKLLRTRCVDTLIWQNSDVVIYVMPPRVECPHPHEWGQRHNTIRCISAGMSSMVYKTVA
jgi:hypothetical protein